MDVNDELEKMVRRDILDYSKGSYYERPIYWTQEYWRKVYGIDSEYTLVKPLCNIGR